MCIDKMTNEELDRLIAKKVMGVEFRMGAPEDGRSCPVEGTLGEWFKWPGDKDGWKCVRCMWGNYHPSTDIGQAMEVAEILVKRIHVVFSLSFDDVGDWHAGFYTTDDVLYTYSADKPAEAIVRAIAGVVRTMEGE